MQKYDAVIIGGGMVGLLQAVILARFGFDIAVIESSDLAKTATKEFDGRVSAITLSSQQILEKIGIWDALKKHAEPIMHIRISDNDSKLFLDYDSEIIEGSPMGYIVENRYIRESLIAAARDSSIEIFSPTSYESISHHPSHIEAKIPGKILKAKLLIAADGKKSRVARQAGIENIIWDYGQDGIVCTIHHEKPHRQIACERFLPAGPFAILPMQGGHHSSLVWTEARKLTPFFLKMDKKNFLLEVRKRFGDFLGALELVGPRFSFPLSLYHAKRYTAERLALIGDAAHSIHPVAGQRLNLGIRDAAILAELLAVQKNLGLDIGSSLLLEKYEHIRKGDNLLMMSVTDGLNHLFSNNIIPLKLARDLGLAAVNKLPALKKFFMLHAIGGTGYQPELSIPAGKTGS